MSGIFTFKKMLWKKHGYYTSAYFSLNTFIKLNFPWKKVYKSYNRQKENSSLCVKDLYWSKPLLFLKKWGSAEQTRDFNCIRNRGLIYQRPGVQRLGEGHRRIGHWIELWISTYNSISYPEKKNKWTEKPHRL